MNRCPQCFTPTETTGAAFICVGSCPVELDRPASTVLGFDVSSKRVFEVFPPEPEPRSFRTQRRPQSGACPTCKTASSKEVCMVCHQALPAGWRDLETTCIVLVGARASGKSVYIAVLVHQLKLFFRRLGRTFDAADDATATAYTRVYEDPLFGRNVMLDSTRGVNPANKTALPIPLVFRVGGGRGRTRVLVLRDLPGESLQSSLDSDIFGICTRADGVVFLIDPFQVRIIREMLVEVIPEQSSIGLDAQLVLGHFTRLMHRVAGNARISVPMAVVISKFDALQRLREVDDPRWKPIMNNPGAAFRRDRSALTPGFDDGDADLLAAEVSSLLHLLGAEDLLTQLEAEYGNSRLFVVSALGHSPAGDRLHTNGIAPFRVLDPIKWILAQSGLLRERV